MERKLILIMIWLVGVAISCMFILIEFNHKGYWRLIDLLALLTLCTVGVAEYWVCTSGVLK